MKVGRVAAVGALLALHSACAINASHPTNPADLPTVSVTDLLAHADDYAGRRVRVEGFLVLKFEATMLWADEEAYRARRWDQTVWVDTEGYSWEMRRRLSERHGTVTGLAATVRADTSAARALASTTL